MNVYTFVLCSICCGWELPISPMLFKVDSLTRPNRNIFPLLSVKQPWGIWVDISHDSINKLWYNYCYYYTRFQCYCILVPKIWVISSQPHMVFIIPQGQCKWDQIWSISSLVALENIEAWTGSTFCGSKVGILLVSLFHAHLRLSKYAFGLTYNVLSSLLVNSDKLK